MAERGVGGNIANPDRFGRWEPGLPAPEELTPLNQTLISPILASAFSIKDGGLRADKSEADVERSAQVTACSQPASSRFLACEGAYFFVDRI